MQTITLINNQIGGQFIFEYDTDVDIANVTQDFNNNTRVTFNLAPYVAEDLYVQLRKLGWNITDNPYT